MSGGFQEELLNFATSVVTPGHRHPWSMRILNFALIGLAVTLSCVLLFGRSTIHHFIMLVMSLCLLAAVHWFIRAVDALPQSPKAEKKTQ